MNAKSLASCLLLATMWVAAPGFAGQLPGPLTAQLPRLAALYGDARSREDVEGRMLQRVTRAPGDELALVMWGINGFAGGKRDLQFLAVFAVEKNEQGAPHFRLVDVIAVGGHGWRRAGDLKATVAHDARTGDTSIAFPALENTRSDPPGAPSGKVTVRLKLKNGRLSEDAPAR